VRRVRSGERELGRRVDDEGVPVAARDEIRRLSVEQGSGSDGRQDSGGEAGTKAVPRSHEEWAAVISSSRIRRGLRLNAVTLLPAESRVNAFLRRDARRPVPRLQDLRVPGLPR